MAVLGPDLSLNACVHVRFQMYLNHQLNKRPNINLLYFKGKVSRDQKSFVKNFYYFSLYYIEEMYNIFYRKIWFREMWRKDKEKELFVHTNLCLEQGCLSKHWLTSSFVWSFICSVFALFDTVISQHKKLTDRQRKSR